MTMIINLPLFVTLSGVLAWLYATYQVHSVTSRHPSLRDNFPGNKAFPGK